MVLRVNNERRIYSNQKIAKGWNVVKHKVTYYNVKGHKLPKIMSVSMCVGGGGDSPKPGWVTSYFLWKVRGVSLFSLFGPSNIWREKIPGALAFRSSITLKVTWSHIFFYNYSSSVSLGIFHILQGGNGGGEGGEDRSERGEQKNG
jgi:hypothetical protein